MDLLELLKLLEIHVDKKNACFSKLYEKSELHQKVLEDSNSDFEDFNLILDQKDELLQISSDLEKEMDEIMKAHGNLLQVNLEKYPDQVNKVIGKVKEMELWTEKILEIEKKNKQLVETFLNRKRLDVKAFRNTQSAVNRYAQNMPNMHQNYQSYFLDKKK